MPNFRKLERLIAGGAATVADFDGIAPSEVHRIKSELPYQVRGQLVARAEEPVAEPTLPAEPKDRVIRHIANVQLVDRMGDLILSNPADAKKYDGEAWITRHWRAAGAPFLWQHQSDQPAIGVCLAETIEQVAVSPTDAPGGKAWALIIRVHYLADESIPLSVPAYLLAKAGITGTSVGFLSRKAVWIEDDKERNEIGLGRWGSLLVTNELLELSKAQIPANPWSVATGKGVGDQERRAAAALDDFVRRGVIGKALRDDFARLMPLGPADAAERLETRVRSFIPQAKEVRGRPCVGLECLVRDDREVIVPLSGNAANVLTVHVDRGPGEPGFPAPAKTDCGCGKGQPVAGTLELTAEDDVPPRSMRRVRGAFELLSAVLEQLAPVIDDEGDEPAPEKSSELLAEMADGVPSTLSPELRAALVDPDSLAVLDLMARRMAHKSTTSRGGSRGPASTGPQAIEPLAGGDATRGRNAQAARDPAVDAALSALTKALAGSAPTTT